MTADVCVKGLPSAHRLHICNELKLSTEDEIHFWSISEALSWAKCPEDVSKSPCIVQQTCSLSVYKGVSSTCSSEEILGSYGA